MNASDAVLNRLIEYWETLTPEGVRQLGQHYAEAAYFRDPFNEVRGLPAIAAIFTAMFERLLTPRFRIVETVSEGTSTFLIWDFTYRIRALKPALERTIHGTSHLRFGADGRVTYHRDYWDAAGELYEHLPLLGPVLRGVRRRLA